MATGKRDRTNRHRLRVGLILSLPDGPGSVAVLMGTSGRLAVALPALGFLLAESAGWAVSDSKVRRGLRFLFPCCLSKGILNSSAPGREAGMS
jgi:hypothetical protein